MTTPSSTDLQKVRIAYIEAHASKPVRQADLSFFLDPRRKRVAQQTCAGRFRYGVPDLVTVQ